MAYFQCEGGLISANTEIPAAAEHCSTLARRDPLVDEAFTTESFCSTRTCNQTVMSAGRYRENRAKSALLNQDHARLCTFVHGVSGGFLVGRTSSRRPTSNRGYLCPGQPLIAATRTSKVLAARGCSKRAPVRSGSESGDLMSHRKG
jgi:hypothetical protein